MTREELATLLGGGPRDTGPVTVERLGQTEMNGVRVVEVALRHAGGAIPATLLPAQRGPGPAVLYCHAHGNRPDIGRAELVAGRPALLDPPLGLALARAGFTVLCPDMPGFGARQGEGTESALSKQALWEGRPLLSRMLADLGVALRALAAMDAVAPTRIAACGFSMGATLAYWFAALEPRVAAAAHCCAFADMRGLIDAGAHDLHGPYMTVPGLLKLGDMSDVAGLVAPRPQFVAAGAQDPLTPPPALEPALAGLRSHYAAAGAADRLELLVEPRSGHAETPAMRAALLAFLARL